MKRFVVIGGMLALAVWPAASLAETLSSPNYHIDESFVGGGGLINESSANFQAAESIGDTAIGNSASTNFQTNSSYTTDGDPALTFAILSTTPTFNDLSSTAASTATSQFSVINYTSYGYVVQIYGNTPSNGSHVIPAMSSAAPSQSGTEQYGINLVANSSPVSFGADPDNGNPTFGYGAANAGYNTANNYKYVEGDTIASAAKSSGKTIYTLAYLINAADLTPGGYYQTHHTLVCVGTY